MALIGRLRQAAGDDKTAGSVFEAEGEALALADRLPDLLVEAMRVSNTIVHGIHGRRRSGPGETFWQFRQYQTGDMMRQIDWRQSAKSDRLYIRETEWSAAQSAWLWRDRSPSMDYRSHRSLPTKRHRADVMLLALSSLLIRADERIALLDGEYRPRSGRVALDRMTLQLMHDYDHDPKAEKAMRERPGQRDLPPFQALPRHAHLILFGDLLSPVEEIDAICRQYAARGIEGHLVQVLDPAEEDLPFTGRTRFEGMEAEGALLIKRVENVRDGYKERMDAHQAALQDMTRALGWSYTRHRTDHAPERTLLSLYLKLAEPA